MEGVGSCYGAHKLISSSDVATSYISYDGVVRDFLIDTWSVVAVQSNCEGDSVLQF